MRLPKDLEWSVFDIADARNSLQSLLWRYASVERTREGLELAEEQIANWSRYILTTVTRDPAGWEIQNLMTVAAVLLRMAATRTESRGTHFRSDYPKRSDKNWRVRLVTRKGAGG